MGRVLLGFLRHRKVEVVCYLVRNAEESKLQEFRAPEDAEPINSCIDSIRL
jgi:hypothetical protein